MAHALRPAARAPALVRRHSLDLRGLWSRRVPVPQSIAADAGGVRVDFLRDRIGDLLRVRIIHTKLAAGPARSVRTGELAADSRDDRGRNRGVSQRMARADAVAEQRGVR